MKKSIRIIFANQKGGVGKSTLCILFANYLAYWKRPVCVIDTDIQATIASTRNFDARTNDGEPPYEVYPLSLDDPEAMEHFMEQSADIEGYQLFDTAGRLDDDVIGVLLTHADFIIVPFEMEAKSMMSTSSFLRVMAGLKERMGVNPRLFLVPNKYDRRIGTAEELKSLAGRIHEMSGYGIVTPCVHYRAHMMRINTYRISDTLLKSAVYEAFKYIVTCIESQQK